MGARIWCSGGSQTVKMTVLGAQRELEGLPQHVSIQNQPYRYVGSHKIAWECALKPLEHLLLFFCKSGTKMDVTSHFLLRSIFKLSNSDVNDDSWS